MMVENDAGFDAEAVKNILEGAMLAAGEALNVDQFLALFADDGGPQKADIRRALAQLQDDYAERGVELVEVASGWRLQVRHEFNPWISKLWEERPPRYSRALMETLALIAYRQPITRGEIEDVRGVSVSTQIIRTLEEREWIRVLGHRDVPGKPALFGTTKAFLDYFGLKSLDELPSLAALADIGAMEPELDFSQTREPDSGAGAAEDDHADTRESSASNNDADDPARTRSQDTSAEE